MKDLQLVLRSSRKAPDQFGQRKHKVLNGGDIIGTMYDNRDCPTQKINFVFHPESSRVCGTFLPRENSKYLIHGDSIRGDDLHEVLADIKLWANTICLWFEGQVEKLRGVLDSLEVPEYTLSNEAKQYKGVKAQILGGDGSYALDISWDDMAKLHGYSYFELKEYQVTDSGVRGQGYGLKWTYFGGSPTISINSYSGTNFMKIKRSEAHIALKGC